MSSRSRHRAAPASPRGGAAVPTAGAASAARRLGPWLVIAVFTFQAVLLALAAKANSHQLNADAVAYLRLAHDYATGRWALAISGYWGPLLSWLAVPWLKLGLAPLTAGRVVMGLSGLVFAVGALGFFRSLGLPNWLGWLGFAVSALAAVAWSVEEISPDLLAGGLVLLGMAALLRETWSIRPSAAFVTGLLWGLAYLAKAVALPLALLTTTIATLLWGATRRVGWRLVIRNGLLTVAGALLVASPWITVLSRHYHHFTFSTSGAIAHAVAGPPDMDRYHPFARMFEAPPPGRITTWEDPSRMPYHYWSPFSSAAYFRYQLHLCLTNAEVVAVLFGEFAAAFVSWLGILGAVWVFSRGRTVWTEERWAWAVLFVLGLGAIYVPVYVGWLDQRYFYVALPVLLAGTFGAAHWVGKQVASRFPRLPMLLLIGAAVAFGGPALRDASQAAIGLPHPSGQVAWLLARQMAQHNLRGPIAGSAMILGNRTGLFTAFLLDEPWFGDKPNASADQYAHSGAQYIIVRRQSRVAAECRLDPRFQSCDPVLFGSAANAARFPVEVFAVNPHRQ